MYNLIQEDEVFIFLEYLPNAVKHVVKNDSLWTGEGRQPNELFDVLTCLAIQHYFGKSLRRSMGLIRLCIMFARIPIEIPCFKTLSNYRNNEFVQNYMDKLIEITSNPLRYIEADFSTDATGESTSCSSTYFNLRMKRRISRKQHLNVHVTTTRKLNSVAALNINCNPGKDSVIMREHIKEVRKNFEKINDWSGDSKYLARKNCDAVSEAGGTPWFMIKKNTKARAKGSKPWRDMVKTAKNNPEEFGLHYHKRSNSESTNSAKKRKFGNSVRSINDIAKENESYWQWIGYNFSVLGRAKHEYGVIPKWMN